MKFRNVCVPEVRAKLGKGGTWWIAVGFFLISVGPGLWIPTLSNVLNEKGVGWAIPYAFALGPLASLFSPLIFGSMADYRFSAQKLAGVLSIVGAVFLGMAFVSLQLGWGAWTYLGFQAVNALIGAPMWALLSTVTLASDQDAGKKFPLFRVWGTVGWIVAGLAVSYLDWDSSPLAGITAAVVRLFFGVACFMMPDTKPQGKLDQGKGVPLRANWRKYFGLEALVLFKEPSMRVFLLTSVLFAVPLAAFYIYAPVLLKELNDPHPTASMTLGQLTEIVAMLILGGLLSRGRIRWVLTAALAMGVLRYGLFAFSGWSNGLLWMWLGVALHGPCYTFYFVTAQMLVDRRIDVGMRSQAQALLGTLGAVGGLTGSLLCGWFFATTEEIPHGWVFFWGMLALAVLGCGIYFVCGYGRQSKY